MYLFTYIDIYIYIWTIIDENRSYEQKNKNMKRFRGKKGTR